MLIFEFIVAVVAVGLVAARPRNMTVALGVLGPAVAFLWAVMTLAVLAERSGLADGLAAGLIAAGRGSTLRLFYLVCAACAMLTAALSLDGAVVVMAPVLVALRRHGVPPRPLLLGTVAVANAFSAALPAGNPTNLVVMERLGVSPEGFVVRMAAPSLLATCVCVIAVMLLERRSLSAPYPRVEAGRLGLGSGQRLPALALAAAALADWLSPLLGLSPWLPVSAIALAVGRQLPRSGLPIRVGAQVAGLLLALDALRASLPLDALHTIPSTLVALLAVAGLAAAL